jgi:hypothetical protein
MGTTMAAILCMDLIQTASRSRNLLKGETTMSNDQEDSHGTEHGGSTNNQHNERLWCRTCGTVTRDRTCDCTEYHKVGSSLIPDFVNYADAMQEAAHAEAQKVAQLKAQVTELEKEIERLQVELRWERLP